MSRSEALKKFQIEVVTPAQRETIQRLDRHFRQDYPMIFQQFLEAFRPFLEQLKQTQKSVSYVQISWLRTSLFSAQPLGYLFEAYSEKWYADVDEIVMEWKFDWLGESIKAMHAKLSEERHKFDVLEADIRKIIYNMYPLFNRYVQEAIYHGFRNYDVTELMDGVNLGSPYAIRMGEYLDYSEKLTGSPTMRDNRAKVDFLKHNKAEIAGEDLRDIDLTGSDFHGGQYSYTDFSRANFGHSDFSESVMRNTNFREAQLDGVNFAKSIISDCDFERASLKGADFKLCKGNIADLTAEIPCLFGVNFRGADLREADFRMSALKGADFTDATMTGAKFLLRDQANWQFSEAQQQAIQWHS